MALADRQRIAAGTAVNQLKAAYSDGRREGIELVCDTLANWEIGYDDDGLFRDPADLERLFVAIMEFERNEQGTGYGEWSGHLSAAATARVREAATPGQSG